MRSYKLLPCRNLYYVIVKCKITQVFHLPVRWVSTPLVSDPSRVRRILQMKRECNWYGNAASCFPRSTSRATSVTVLHFSIFDRTRIAKYAFERIVSVCVPNLYCTTIECKINASFAYQFYQSRRRSSRRRCVPCPARSANERASGAPTSHQKGSGNAAALLARKVNRAGNEAAKLITFTFHLRNCYFYCCHIVS